MTEDVQLISKTTGAGKLDGMMAEEIIAYTARVSNPSNQANSETAPRLLAYLLDHSHWSPFEMADFTVEITTSRMISPQILRHWSFSFQEFSQRYAALDESGVVIYAARRQDSKNRQNSIDDLTDEVKKEWEDRQIKNWRSAFEHYQWAIDNQIAKECARAVLPLGAKTVLYMKGSVRDWIHYLTLRTENGTQAEHAWIADKIKAVFVDLFPSTAAALGWEQSS